jgi:hypothetical protein
VHPYFPAEECQHFADERIAGLLINGVVDNSGDIATPTLLVGPFDELLRGLVIP